MSQRSGGSFRIAYFVDTFPRRTENFILREIAGVLKYWPDLQIYCFHVQPSDWEYVDCQDRVRGIPQASISFPLSSVLAIHLKWMARRPLRYLSGLRQSAKIHGFFSFRAFRRFDQAIRLADLADRDGITHLHAHFASEPATVCHLAARMLSTTYSVSAHAEDIWARRPYAPVLEDATCCITCTAEGRDYLKGEFPRARVHLVHHGLFRGGGSGWKDPTAHSRSGPPPLRIISAGRFIAKKGFDILIEACALLSERGIDYQCEILGEGELRSLLVNRIQRLGLADKIKLSPFVPWVQFRKRLSAAHLCVLPSRIDPTTNDRDGIPNVLLEAIDCSTVVVTSDLPTLREINEDKITGFLALPDNPLELANTIQKALFAEANWPQIHRRARGVIASDFELEKNLNRFRKIVEDSIEK